MTTTKVKDYLMKLEQEITHLPKQSESIQLLMAQLKEKLEDPSSEQDQETLLSLVDQLEEIIDVELFWSS